jgi:hypothetical protein
MFFVTFNYARHLRKGHQLDREVLWLSIQRVNSSYKINFLIILIIIIVITLVSFTCISPLVYKVHNSLKKVNLLFGFLSKQQISSLEKRCDYFRENYLVESLRLTSLGYSIGDADIPENSEQSEVYLISRSSEKESEEQKEFKEMDKKKSIRSDSQSDESESSKGGKSLSRDSQKNNANSARE